MLLVHISDESVAYVEKHDPPNLGEHLDEWLSVLKELSEWRVANHPNQVLLPVSLPTVQEVARTVEAMKPNSPLTPAGYEMLYALKSELPTAELVKMATPEPDVPVRDDVVYGIRLEPATAVRKKAAPKKAKKEE